MFENIDLNYMQFIGPLIVLGITMFTVAFLHQGIL